MSELRKSIFVVQAAQGLSTLREKFRIVKNKASLASKAYLTLDLLASKWLQRILALIFYAEHSIDRRVPSSPLGLSSFQKPRPEENYKPQGGSNTSLCVPEENVDREDCFHMITHIYRYTSIDIPLISGPIIFFTSDLSKKMHEDNCCDVLRGVDTNFRFRTAPFWWNGEEWSSLDERFSSRGD